MTAYLRIPLPTEPADVLSDQVTDLQTRVPGWVGQPGNLDQSLLEVVAFTLATLLDVAGSVQDTIFRELLASLFGILPDDATFATVDSTWTMKDSAGYSIPAATEVKVATAGDTAIGFEVVNTVTVSPGSTITATGGVQLRALVAGSSGSGLSGTASMVTPIEGPTVVTLVGVSVGGRDAEEDAAFLDRGRKRLQRLTFGLVLPADVEQAILEIDGVSRVLVIDNYVAGTNELQDITVTLATGGSFTATYSGQTTGAIQWNAAAGAVQTALESLSNIDVGDVIATGGPLMTAPVRIEFTGLLARTNVAAMTVTSSLTGAGSQAVAVTTARSGIASTPAAAASLTVVPIDAAGQPVPSGVLATVMAMLAASREQGFLFTSATPTYTPITLTFVATAYSGFDAASVLAAAISALTSYLSPANWGIPAFGDQRTWIQKTTVRHGELYAVINGVPGLDEVTSLVVNGVSDGDVSLSGLAPMPSATPTISGVVT
jgi:hypothetical protein